WHEVRATLTVGADGRFSRVRLLLGIEPVATSPPMDVLWFRLPRLPEDPREPTGVFGGFGRGHILVVLDRFDYWQVGYVFPKGGISTCARPDSTNCAAASPQSSRSS